LHQNQNQTTNNNLNDKEKKIPYNKNPARNEFNNKYATQQQ
jgi:hypothetical protein